MWYASQKRAHWETSPVKSGVPTRLCELKQGFKDYRHLSVPLEPWATNVQFFSPTPLSRQYRYNRRINHCFEVSKRRFHADMKYEMIVFMFSCDKHGFISLLLVYSITNQYNYEGDYLIEIRTLSLFEDHVICRYIYLARWERFMRYVLSSILVPFVLQYWAANVLMVRHMYNIVSNTGKLWHQQKKRTASLLAQSCIRICLKYDER